MFWECKKCTDLCWLCFFLKYCIMIAGTLVWHTVVGSKQHLSQRGNFFRNEVLRCVSGHDCGLSLDASLLFKQLFIFNWDCLFWWNIDREAQVATFWNSSYRTYLCHHFFAHSLLFKNEKTRSSFTGRTHYYWPSLFNHLSFYLATLQAKRWKTDPYVFNKIQIVLPHVSQIT
jgi:hypothetical protein